MFMGGSDPLLLPQKYHITYDYKIRKSENVHLLSKKVRSAKQK